MIDYCNAWFCFFSLDPTSPNIFTFSEFLSALALMVIAWTVADVRYRFRLKVASINIFRVSVVVIPLIGALTLLTDLWRVSGWPVIEGHILTPEVWQALLGGLCLLVFLSWVWASVIQPAKFNKLNSGRYARELYRKIIDSSQSEIPVIADELSYSIKSIVQKSDERYFHVGFIQNNPRVPYVEHANIILHLIADKKFCRSLIRHAPRTISTLFQSLKKDERYNARLNIFARNLINEAINNKDSFMYHESDAYESGFIGQTRPITTTLFGSFNLVEDLDGLLEPDPTGRYLWEVEKWEAYSRAILLVIDSYVSDHHRREPFALSRAIGHISDSPRGLYEINKIEGTFWEHHAYQKLSLAVDFIVKVIGKLEALEVPPFSYRTARSAAKHETNFLHFDIANNIFDLVFKATEVTEPSWTCWSIQHNLVWSSLFDYSSPDKKASKLIHFRLRRLFYNEVLRLRRSPNFKGARLVGLFLNVMGLSTRGHSENYPMRPLHEAVLAWVKTNFIWLHRYNPNITEVILINGISFDQENLRLVKTYNPVGLRAEPHYEYLYLNRS